MATSEAKEAAPDKIGLRLAEALMTFIDVELTKDLPAATGENEHEVNLAVLRRVVLIDGIKTVAKAIEKKLNQLRQPLETQTLAMFEKLGTNNFNIDGRTVYLHREWWAKSKNPENPGLVIDALKTCDETAGFVKEQFNTQTVSAYFRERRTQRQEAIERIIEKHPDIYDRYPDFESEIEGNPCSAFELDDIEVIPLFPTRRLADALEFSETTSARSRAGGK